MSHPIVLFHPYIPIGTKESVSAVLGTRWIGQGPLVEEFERRFSAQESGRPAVAVGSCTDALHLAYILAGIKPGDEVLAPLFTCTATNEALLYCGAKIRFVDVAPNSLNVDPQAMGDMIDERTKAMVVVHYGGIPVPVVRHLLTFGPGRHIPLIEDCAQSLGSEATGLWGDYACYSFQAIKHITTGDGGMLMLQDTEQLARAKRLRWFGIDRVAKLGGVWENDITELGYKYQMTDIAAAMGIAGLDALDHQRTVRRVIAEYYAVSLEGIPGITVLDRDPCSANWLMTVLVERREDLRRKLKDAGIESDQVHYRNDRYSIFREFARDPRTSTGFYRGPVDFPNMDAVESKYLCLPMHMALTQEDVARVCDVIKSGW